MAFFTRNLAAVAILAAVSAAPVIGVQASAALTPQQQRMNDCNGKASAQALKGNARKSYMSACLSGKNAAPTGKPLSVHQQKMVACNAQAGAQKLGGEARKIFMKSCLKK